MDVSKNDEEERPSGQMALDTARHGAGLFQTLCVTCSAVLFAAAATAAA